MSMFEAAARPPARPNKPNRPPRPEDPKPPEPAGPPPMGTGSGGSGQAMISQLLTRYGLGSLVDWAWQQLLDGNSEDEIMLLLRDRPEFRDRFKGMFMREEQGFPPISIEEYLAYENQAFQMFREFGFPPGFYDDHDDFAQLIGQNVSINELQQRTAAYADAAAVGRETYRRELGRFVNGAEELSVGDLAAVMIDPSRALPVLRQKMQAAGVSTAAADSGFGSLSFDEASRLTGRGLEEAAARQAFTALASQGDVVRRLAGEVGPGMAREDQLGVIEGSAEDITELERRRRGRTGAFAGGGSFAVNNEGVGGAGRA